MFSNDLRLEKIMDELEQDNIKNLEEFKFLVDKLIRENNPSGFKALGYAHYLGYPGFEKDYKLALDAFLKGPGLHNDPYVTNTIGYIYYYGRTTNNVPQYEKAFEYFIRGAESGVTESIYKIIDMYYYGQGITKNVEHAINSYKRLYLENLDFFTMEMGLETKFADLCLRQGRVILDQEKKSTLEALSYFLEAKYALEKRKEINYVGDEKIYQETLEQISKLNRELKIDPKDTKELSLGAPFCFNNIRGLKELPYELECSFIKEENDQVLLSIFDRYGRSFFITIPHLNYCSLIYKLQISFKAHIEENLKFSFADFEVDEKLKIITISDYLTPKVQIKFNDMELQL